MILDYRPYGGTSLCLGGDYRPWVPMEHHIDVGCLCASREWSGDAGAGFMQRDGGRHGPICLLGHLIESTTAPDFSFKSSPFIQLFATQVLPSYPVEAHPMTSTIRGLTSRFWVWTVNVICCCCCCFLTFIIWAFKKLLKMALYDGKCFSPVLTNFCNIDQSQEMELALPSSGQSILMGPQLNT